jgi:hypothetical protein
LLRAKKFNRGYQMTKLEKLMRQVDQEAPAQTFGSDRLSLRLWKQLQSEPLKNQKQIQNDLTMLLSSPDSEARTRRIASWLLEEISLLQDQIRELELNTEDFL